MLTKKFIKKVITSYDIKIRGISNYLYTYNQYNFCTKKQIYKSKPVKKTNIVNEENETTETKTIKLVQENVPIKINPYFGSKDTDTAKKSTSVSVNKEEKVSLKKNESQVSEEQKLILEKSKQRLIKTKEQKKAKSIQVIMTNIKRDLPKEL